MTNGTRKKPPKVLGRHIIHTICTGSYVSLTETRLYTVGTE